MQLVERLSRPTTQTFARLGLRRAAPHDRTVSVWGWMPVLSMTSAFGLLLLGIAYSVARTTGGSIGYGFYWCGLICLFAPIAYRLLMPDAARQERFALVFVVGVAVYLVKVLLSPNGMYFGDEFTHWRNVSNILQTNHLFSPNSILPITGLYPGLQIAAAAVADLSGLSIYHSAIIVVGTARILLVLSLYLFFEAISGSSRVAGVATLVYAANTNFVFYGQQFGYESLSLSLAVFGTYLIVRQANLRDQSSLLGLKIAALLAILAVIPTHHMTSYALVVFLSLLTVMTFIYKRRPDFFDRLLEPLKTVIYKLSRHFRIVDRLIQWLLRLEQSTSHEMKENTPQEVSGFALLALLATLFWLFVFASLTIGYLSPVLGGAVNEFLTFITGQSKAKEVFSTIPGQEIPIWERMTAIGGVGLILTGTMAGIYQVWRRYTHNVVALTMSIVALCYPVTLALRLTRAGSETANRSSEFLFLALGVIIALAVVELWLVGQPRFWRYLVATVYLTTIFAGGLITGMAWWARLPGPYLVAGDSRGIQPQGVMAAEWAAEHLGRDSRVIADSANRKLLGSYGQQFTVPGLSWLFFSPVFEDAQTEALVKNHISYIVTDYRITANLPMNGIYFDSKEPGSGSHLQPFDPALLDKFDHLPYASRIFHSGDIVFYDVRPISGAGDP